LRIIHNFHGAVFIVCLYTFILIIKIIQHTAKHRLQANSTANGFCLILISQFQLRIIHNLHGAVFIVCLYIFILIIKIIQHTAKHRLQANSTANGFCLILISQLQLQIIHNLHGAVFFVCSYTFTLS